MARRQGKDAEKPHDPGTFTIAAIAMVLTACLAAWVPARRAARVNPVEALRAE